VILNSIEYKLQISKTMRGIAAKTSCLDVEYIVKSENIVYLNGLFTQPNV